MAFRWWPLFPCLLSLLVGLSTGCGDGDDGAHPLGAQCGIAGPCDIREVACQRRAIAAAGCLRGEDPRELDVDIAVIAYDVLLAELRDDVEDEPLSQAERTFRGALSTISLSRAEASAQGDLEDSLATLAAFYVPGSVVVIDRGEPLDDSLAFSVLVHEIVHALQDLAGDFASEGRADTFDTWLARRAVVEGEATLLGLQAQAIAAGRSLDDIDWSETFREFQDEMRLGARDADDPWLEARVWFPYAWGGAFVLAAAEAGGPDAVRALYSEDEPRSTRTVLLGDDAAEHEVPPLGEEAVPLTPNDFELRGTSTLGSWLALSLALREDLDLDFELGYRSGKCDGPGTTRRVASNSTAMTVGRARDEGRFAE